MILWSLEGILGVSWQNGSLMWLHQASYDLLKVYSKCKIVFCLALKERGLARGTYNSKPDKIILPFSLRYSQTLWADSISFQEMVVKCTDLDNHVRPDKSLTALSQLPIIVKPQSISSFCHIPKGTMAFTDANKARYEVLTQRPWK